MNGLRTHGRGIWRGSKVVWVVLTGPDWRPLNSGGHWDWSGPIIDKETMDFQRFPGPQLELTQCSTNNSHTHSHKNTFILPLSFFSIFFYFNLCHLKNSGFFFGLENFVTGCEFFLQIVLGIEWRTGTHPSPTTTHFIACIFWSFFSTSFLTVEYFCMCFS